MTSNSDKNVIREKKEYPFRNVAVVSLINDDGALLFVRTVRFPDHWQPIGGGMEPEDKSPIDALVRELREEAGLIINPDLLQLTCITDYDFGEGKVYFYTYKLQREDIIKLDRSEIVEWKWIDLDNASSLNMFPATRKFISNLQTNIEKK